MERNLCGGLRVGNGYDVHALKEGLPMWLCGVNVPSEKGFVAHSDGDVAIHALCGAAYYLLYGSTLSGMDMDPG